MSRIFNIKIIFNKETTEEDLIYDGVVKDENGIVDKLRISTHTITLECKRSRDRNLNRLLTDFKSTISFQITKAISFYIAVKGSLPQIKKIVIIKLDKLGNQTDYYETKNVMQPFENKLLSNFIFKPDDLKILFEGNEKAKALLVALSFWLRGISSWQPSEKFEKLWTSFNTLYSFITSEKSEVDKLIKMRHFIINNSNLFPMSCSIFESFDKNKIRELQWRNLILNDYDTPSKTKAFYNFIMRYSDYRINQVFNEILCYRKEYLLDNEIFYSLEAHIANSINKGESKNEEILTFYLIKYSYFIRNKYFHGEKINPIFNLVKNDEIKELNLLNEILETFLKELVSANNYY